MRVTAAGRALYDGVFHPANVKRATVDAAVSIFSVIVLLLTAADTAATFIESSDPSLVRESAALIHAERLLSNEGTVDISTPSRQFTAVMGGALVKSIVSILMLSAIGLGAARFLTSGIYGAAVALACVSAASAIELLRSVVETSMHMIFHTIRAGLHAGVFVDPSLHPFLFSWLQRIDLFGIWFYLAFAVAMVSWEGLHFKYGLVIGGVVFVVVQTVFALLTVMSWIVMGPV